MGLMGTLQQSLPYLALIPKYWLQVVLDINDYFYNIHIMPTTVKLFVIFHKSTISNKSTICRFHCTILPQGRINLSTMCQYFVCAVLYIYCARFFMFILYIIWMIYCLCVLMTESFSNYIWRCACWLLVYRLPQKNSDAATIWICGICFWAQYSASPKIFHQLWNLTLWRIYSPMYQYTVMWWVTHANLLIFSLESLLLPETCTTMWFRNCSATKSSFKMWSELNLIAHIRSHFGLPYLIA